MEPKTAGGQSSSGRPRWHERVEHNQSEHNQATRGQATRWQAERAERYTLDDLTISVSTIGRTDPLRHALRSIADVEPPGLRLQIVANGAPQTIRDLKPELSSWGGPVSIVETAERKPIAEAHQIALDHCTTRLINFMGDDDLCLAPRLQRKVDLFNDIPSLVIASCWAHRIGGSLSSPRFGGKADLGPSSLREWQLYRDRGQLIQFCFPATVFDREGLLAVGGCDQRWGGAFDVAMTARLATYGPAIALADRPFGFRIHANSVSSLSFEEMHLRVKYVYACQDRFEAGLIEPTYDEFLETMANLPALERFRDRQSMRSRQFFRAAGSSWLEGRRIPAYTAAFLALANSPAAFARKLRDNRGRTPDEG